MGQTSETTPAQFVAPRVGGIQLLPRRKGTPNHCWALRKYLEELVKQSFLKEHVLTPEAISRHPNNQSPREQYMITQYKAIY